MMQKTGLDAGQPNAAKQTGVAEYCIVDMWHGTIGPELLCRTIANTPANEAKLRGMA